MGWSNIGSVGQHDQSYTWSGMQRGHLTWACWCGVLYYCDSRNAKINWPYLRLVQFFVLISCLFSIVLERLLPHMLSIVVDARAHRYWIHPWFSFTTSHARDALRFTSMATALELPAHPSSVCLISRSPYVVAMKAFLFTFIN